MTIEKNIYINCDGCKGSCKNEFDFYLDSNDNKIICPCSFCLIKGVCINGCDNFEKYVKQILGSKRKC